MFAAAAMPVPEPVYDGDLGEAINAYAAARARSRRLSFKEQAEAQAGKLARNFHYRRHQANLGVMLAAKSVVDALDRLDASGVPIRPHYRKMAADIRKRFVREQPTPPAPVHSGAVMPAN